jgi:hypothetical protein
MENRNAIDWEFRRASELARASWMFQLVAGVARAGALAWNESRAIREARATVGQLSSLAIAVRLRLVGLFVLAAAVTHAVLMLFVPPSLAPAVPYTVPMIGALLAIVLVIASRKVADMFAEDVRKS